MRFGFLVLIVALLIAAISAWFSIVGLMAIFSAAAVSIGIMGGVLEAGKLLAASWLYQHWNTAPIALKTYLSSAVIVLMMITSMGIFGYLSKAHLDQSQDRGSYEIEMERIDSRIERNQRTIDGAQVQLTQLDNALQAYIDEGYVTRGLAARAEQALERTQLEEIINTAEDETSSLRDEQTTLAQQVQGLTVEIGPIKYLAELIYGESTENLIDQTVRIFILILVSVFDPFAVALLLAANYSLLRAGIVIEEQSKDTETPETPETPEVTEVTEVTEVNTPATDHTPTRTSGEVHKNSPLNGNHSVVGIPR